MFAEANSPKLSSKMSKSCEDGSDMVDTEVFSLPEETTGLIDIGEISLGLPKETDFFDENEIAKGLSQETTVFVDKNEMDRLLKIQLEEVEMLQSMFSNPGEFKMFDHSVIADIHEFIEGKSVMLPPRLDFIINLVVDEKKLEISVKLPLDYPEEEPDIYVRSDVLTRGQQHKLNSDLAKHVCSLDKGDISIYPSVAWLQENGDSYFIPEGKIKKPKTAIRKSNVNNKFSRYWIYSHHIYSKMKRRCIISLAQELNITGFCLPGKPGIICIEGLDTDCSDCWQRVCLLGHIMIIFAKPEVGLGLLLFCTILALL